MDDEELEKGEEITPALLKAIEESRIAIVVLSENYASSTFCLQELVKILECVKQNGRLVWPIFYGVNPSDVRHIKGSYEKAFTKHEARYKNDKEKVKEWKLALREVANLSGSHFNPGSEYEFKFTTRIAKKLSIKIHRINLHVADYPVGLESQVKKLNSLLDIESNERVIRIGIYGIGGIGKSTIARALYNLIADQFEGVCFLADVRAKSNLNDGLVQLQELLLSEIVGKKNIKWSDVNKGIPIIKRVLSSKKVLIVLDDVDKLDQLQTLAGGLDWFGSGSRIIITTRDEHLLDNQGVERKYMVEALNHEEAFKLLTWNAFKNDEIDASYSDILNKFLRYCNGLPLALEVLGSNLLGKGLNEWESALDTYKKIPHQDIQKVLKGSDKIRAIILNTPRNRQLQWDGHALEKMKNLRILIVKNACFSCGPKHLPDSLKVLDWEQYPSSSLPSGFNPRKLVILNLKRGCLISHKPFQHFESLSEIDLSYSNLERVPSISAAPNLRKIILDDCPNLIEVDDSIGLLDKLETLSTWRCSNLRIFPEAIHSTSLMELNLTGCFSLLNFPDRGIMERVTHILYGDNYEDDVPRLVLNQLTDKPYNFILDCNSLMYPKLDKIIKGGSSVPALNVTCLEIRYSNLKDEYPSDWLPCFPNLEQLVLSENDEVDQFLSTGLPWFPNLKLLDLFSNDLTILPECIRECHFLTELYLHGCEWLREIRGMPPNIKIFSAKNNNFTTLPECIKECHFLREIYLDDCEQLREIRGIPPNIKILSARNCTSLNVQSSSILLSQVLHEAGGTQFTLPGAMLPEWFGYKQPSESLSFWVRNKFPEKIALCLVTTGMWPKKYYLFVNGFRHDSIFNSVVSSGKPHIHLVHLERGRHIFGEVPIGHEWNHVQVSSDMKGIFHQHVTWMGVHVYNEGNSTENIRFTDPNPGKGKADYLNDTDSNHAFHLIKKWCSSLDMKVLDTDKPLNYGLRVGELWNAIRKMQAPIKVKNLMWNVCKDALPTCMNLFRRNVINSPLCPICKTEYETIEHVFMFCQWTQPVWFGSDLQWCDFDWDFEFSQAIYRKLMGRVPADVPRVRNLAWDWWNFARGRNDFIVGDQALNKIMGTVGHICWAIWKGRNEYILEGKPVDPELALFRVKTLYKQYSHGYPLVHTAVNPTTYPANCSTHCRGEMIENDNEAKGKSVLMASSNSSTKENIGQDGLSSNHDVTWDIPITRSTGDKEEVREYITCKSNFETKKHETLDSIIMNTAIDNDQLTTVREKRKRNMNRSSGVRCFQKPRVEKGKSTTNKYTKWKRNPVHLCLSRQLLQQYKPVSGKGS